MNMKPDGLLLTLLLVLMLGHGSAKHVQPPSTPASPVDQADPSNRQAVWTGQLAAAEKKWATAGVVSYDFTLRVRCFCVGDLLEPHTIQVVKGIPAPLTARSPGTRERLVQLDTVDELFFVARDWVRRLPFKLTLAFDENLGYPTLIDVNPRQMTFDEEVTYLLSDFVVTGRR
jgi:hypothetical protein